MNKIRIFIESGKKKTFAGAVAWPGWCRWGQNEASALQALMECAPRYARVFTGTGVEFQPPAQRAELTIVERTNGNITTDFGAPDSILSADHDPLDESHSGFFSAVLDGCWQAFDRAVLAARGKELRTGPRGGGRDLEKIMQHVLGADQAYLRKLAWKYRWIQDAPLSEQMTQTRQAVLEAIAAGVRQELPNQGPRGGKVWPVRFFVRRLAWHTLDHAWEIEDRLE